MPKYGKVKICKARVSTKHKERCKNSFTTKPGTTQKFCSEKCRKRNFRIVNSDKAKKAKRLKIKIEKTENKLQSTRNRIKQFLKEISEHEKEIFDFENEKKPKAKSKEKYKMSFEQRRLLEKLPVSYTHLTLPTIYSV